MYNTHIEFHSQGDNLTHLLQSSWLAAVLDQSVGQQNIGLFIALTLRWPRSHP